MNENDRGGDPQESTHLFSDATNSPRTGGEKDVSAASSINRSLGFLGDFELLKRLGGGGMGTVYLAHQHKLNRLVALKTIARGNLASAEEVSRLRIEAEAAANLHHPNIAAVYEIGELQGLHFISMQFIDGETLDAWRKKAEPSPKLSASVARDIASAMHHAHIKGIVHRDLKPSNVMMDRDNCIRIVDFGLAKKLSSESQVTISGQIMGTPSFMAPEQASGDSKSVTASSDVYAIGAVLFYLLTGRPPFVANTVLDTLELVKSQPAPSARTLNRIVPMDLSTICGKCLEKHPSNRYATAQDLADDLQRFLDNKPVQARRITTTKRALRWCRRNPMASAFMLVVTTMLAVMSLLFVQANRAVAEADLSFRRQLKTINELLVQIGSSDLKNTENSHVIRRELLQKAEKFYNEARHSGNGRALDDQHLQASTQLASLQGELAATQQERDAALAKLRTLAEELSMLITASAEPTQGSVDDAIETYGLTPELRQWWLACRKSLGDQQLLNAIRQSALTDNLVKQMKLQTDDAAAQVSIATRVLEIREQLANVFPHEGECTRRLAGAQHNLAECYRSLARTENSQENIRRAFTYFASAQQARARLVAEQPSDRLRFEIAKADYGMATAMSHDHLDNLKNAVDHSEEPERLAQTKLLYERAATEFAALVDSPDLTLEAKQQQAISLRGLSVLGLEIQELELPGLDPSMDWRNSAINDSVRILSELCLESPLVMNYKVELLSSRVCFYSISRVFNFAVLDIDQSKGHESVQFALDRDLKTSKSMAIANPSIALKCYLSLANVACITLKQVSYDDKENAAIKENAERKARELFQEVKSVLEQLRDQVGDEVLLAQTKAFEEILNFKPPTSL